METCGNVFRDREEPGPVLFLPCTHTYTGTHSLSQKDAFAAQHYQKCVLYGALLM